MYTRNLAYLIHLPGSWGVYLNELFRRISTSMVGLFIPLYILKETGTLAFIPLYYGIYALAGLLTEYPGALIIKKVGVDKAMAIGSLFRAIFLYSLIFAQYNHLFFVVSAICFGVTQPFDWLTHYYVLAKNSSQKHEFSQSASISKIVTRLGSALGPIMGGFCIQLFGFTTLYLAAGSLILVAAVMPFLDDFEKEGMHVSGREVWQRLKDPGIFKHFIVFGVEAFENLVSTIVWPIFLYTAVGNFEKTGTLETISLFIGLLSLYLVNVMLKNKKYYVMQIGVLFLLLGWVGRLTMHGSITLSLANISYLTGTTFLWVPVWTLLYARSAAKKYTMEFWLVHEMISYFFTFLFSTLIFIAILFQVSMQSIIIITLVLTLTGLFMTRLYQDYIRKYA